MKSPSLFTNKTLAYTDHKITRRFPTGAALPPFISLPNIKEIETSRPRRPPLPPCPASRGGLYPLHGPSKNAGPWIASSAILVPLRFWQSESVPTQGIQFAQGSRAGRQGRAAGTGCFNFYLFRKIYRCELPPDMVLFMEKNFLGILTEM